MAHPRGAAAASERAMMWSVGFGGERGEREREDTGYEPLTLYALPDAGLCRGVWPSRRET